MASVNGFLRNGGKVILADDFGTGNQLLEYLGVDARFQGSLVRDAVFKEKNSLLPRVEADYYDIDYLVLNYPTYLESSYGTVWSSHLSYASDSLDEPARNFGSRPIISEIPIEKGRLVLISDSSLFINSMIYKGGNRNLLNVLTDGTVLVDEAHISTSITGDARTLLAKTYTLFGFYEIRYSLLLALVFGILRVKISIEPVIADSIEEVMRQNPEYDRKQLEWLETERRKVRESKRDR
jgi:hypothetical protein